MISVVTATFLWNFPAVSLVLGSCFVEFSGYSYFFMDFSGCFAVVWGAVLWISAVTATFFQNFSSFWAGLGSCFRSFMDYSGIKIHSRKNDCEFFYEKNHLIDS